MSSATIYPRNGSLIIVPNATKVVREYVDETGSSTTKEGNRASEQSGTNHSASTAFLVFDEDENLLAVVPQDAVNAIVIIPSEDKPAPRPQGGTAPLAVTGAVFPGGTIFPPGMNPGVPGSSGSAGAGVVTYPSGAQAPITPTPTGPQARVGIQEYGVTIGWESHGEIDKRWLDRLTAYLRPQPGGAQ